MRFPEILVVASLALPVTSKPIGRNVFVDGAALNRTTSATEADVGPRTAAGANAPCTGTYEPRKDRKCGDIAATYLVQLTSYESALPSNSQACEDILSGYRICTADQVAAASDATTADDSNDTNALNSGGVFLDNTSMSNSTDERAGETVMIFTFTTTLTYVQGTGASTRTRSVEVTHTSESVMGQPTIAAAPATETTFTTATVTPLPAVHQGDGSTLASVKKTVEAAAASSSDSSSSSSSTESSSSSSSSTSSSSSSSSSSASSSSSSSSASSSSSSSTAKAVVASTSSSSSSSSASSSSSTTKDLVATSSSSSSSASSSSSTTKDLVATSSSSSSSASSTSTSADTSSSATSSSSTSSSQTSSDTSKSQASATSSSSSESSSSSSSSSSSASSSSSTSAAAVAAISTSPTPQLEASASPAPSTLTSAAAAASASSGTASSTSTSAPSTSSASDDSSSSTSSSTSASSSSSTSASSSSSSSDPLGIVGSLTSLLLGQASTVTTARTTLAASLLPAVTDEWGTGTWGTGTWGTGTWGAGAWPTGTWGTGTWGTDAWPASATWPAGQFPPFAKRDVSWTTVNYSGAESQGLCNVTAPAPVEGQTVTGCSSWYVAAAGDDCATIAMRQGVPVETFMAWNPSVNAPECSNLLAGYAYCVEVCDADSQEQTSNGLNSAEQLADLENQLMNAIPTGTGAPALSSALSSAFASMASTMSLNAVTSTSVSLGNNFFSNTTSTATPAPSLPTSIAVVNVSPPAPSSSVVVNFSQPAPTLTNATFSMMSTSLATNVAVAEITLLAPTTTDGTTSSTMLASSTFSTLSTATIGTNVTTSKGPSAFVNTATLSSTSIVSSSSTSASVIAAAQSTLSSLTLNAANTSALAAATPIGSEIASSVSASVSSLLSQIVPSPTISAWVSSLLSEIVPSPTFVSSLLSEILPAVPTSAAATIDADNATATATNPPPAFGAPGATGLSSGFVTMTSTMSANQSAMSSTAAPTSPAGNTLTATSVLYNSYTGDGSTAVGWPDQVQWVDFETLFRINTANMQNSCAQWGVPNNSAQELSDLKSAVQAAGQEYSIDPRFILAIILQESTGCVRVITTHYSVYNPGLMQSHNGTGSCNTNTAASGASGAVQSPCPTAEIQQMVADGVNGTASGAGLVQLLQAQGTGTDAAAYYRAARMYNGGSIDPSGNLDAGCCTLSYASDVANRLVGWVNAPRSFSG